jgi:phage terminase small subunit
MAGRPAALWRRFIVPAWWLTSSDAPKAWLWCELQAEAERSVAAMTAARLAQLRALGSELGFDPASRSRIDAGKKPGADPNSRFFD